MSSAALTRLRKEYIELRKKPVENIRAAPKETDTLEWHYVIEGAKGSPYEGGWYHGVVTFPKDYPYKPPAIQMNTPNGRFKVHRFIFLLIDPSASDLIITYRRPTRAYVYQCQIFTQKRGIHW
jgi:ubiquitin-conjugating enzyme E2 J2